MPVASENFLFVHGGPGFNTHPEQRLLSRFFEASNISVEYWNEPSRNRGDVIHAHPRFLQGLESLEAGTENLVKKTGHPIALVAHSYGSRLAVHLCARRPELFTRLILLAPALDIHHVDLRIFTLTRDDFRKADPEKALEMERILEKCTERHPGQGLFSDDKMEGYLLALQNPALFTHYWVSTALMTTYLTEFIAPRFSFDLEAFRETRFSEPELELPSPLSTPVQLIFGQRDEIIDIETALGSAKSLFRAVETAQFPNSGHYPHIEETPRFLKLMKN